MSLIRFSDQGWEKLRRFKISQREIHVLSVFLNCKDQQEIADTLFISIKTVKHHFTIIYLRLGFRGVGRLWQFFVREQMLEILQPDNQQETVKSQSVTYQRLVK